MASRQSLTVNQNLTIRLLRVLRYNKARIERAMALLPAEHKPLFQVLPFLLHINHPEFPGYVSNSNVPIGLNNFSFRDEIKNALMDFFPMQHVLIEDIKQIWPRQRAIDALLLMGSIGTIAQSDESDFDYWVCVDGKAHSPEALSLLQEKLTAIEQWVQDQYNIEVHFFLSEIDKVRNNDFGIAEGESAGSAQAVLLKSEFYTTNILVAGKAPFWWLVPESTTQQQYYALREHLEEGGSPDPDWFMDLGHIERLDPNELFGAAIWQLGKAMDSSFKSVIKMAKLEVFLENAEHEQPLCNLLKKRVHNGDEAPGNVATIDPYALMFDQVIAHYEAKGDDDVVLLLRQCLYIKCDCELSKAAKDNEASFKRRIMIGYAKRWGWSRNDLMHLDNLENWSFQEKIQLFRRIHQFLILCYRRMSGKMPKDNQLVSQEDMTVLGRRLDTFYSKKPNKIEFLRSGMDELVYCPTVTLKLTRRKNGTSLWTMYSGDQLGKLNKSVEKTRITNAACLVRLMLWCICNRVIDANSEILLDYDTDPISESDLYQFVKHAVNLFPPVKVNSLPRTALISPQKIEACLVVLNFTTSRLKATVEDVVVIYSTSWGETFLANGVEALNGIWYDLQEMPAGSPCCAYVPHCSQRQRVFDAFCDTADHEFLLLS